MLPLLTYPLALIGLSGWDEDAAPMDFDLDKIAVKRIAIARSAQAVALCDAGKFARTAVARIAPVEAFSTVVCDRAPPDQLRRLIEQKGISIVR